MTETMEETNSSSSKETAELPDMKPPSGEYFYHEGKDVAYYGHTAEPNCFVCGQRNRYRGHWQYFDAIVQCMAAGVRINEMFAPHPCDGPKPYKHGSSGLFVNVCGEHIRNGEMLRHLTLDGIITCERILLAQRAAISRQEFRERVAEAARAIWAREEINRQHRNWYDAWELCLHELGHIPSCNERRRRAEQLHEERKEKQAIEDWLTAEKEIGAIFTVAE